MTFPSSYDLPKEPPKIPKYSKNDDGSCRHAWTGITLKDGKYVEGCNVCGEDLV